MDALKFMGGNHIQATDEKSYQTFTEGTGETVGGQSVIYYPDLESGTSRFRQCLKGTGVTTGLLVATAVIAALATGGFFFSAMIDKGDGHKASAAVDRYTGIAVGAGIAVVGSVVSFIIGCKVCRNR